MAKATNRRAFLKQAPAAAAAAAVAAPAAALAQGRRGQADQESPLRERQAAREDRRSSTASCRTATWCSSPASARTSRGTSRRTPSTSSTRWRRAWSAAGSSMEKVLKVNVYLNDLKDYAGMNEMFLGRFGTEPGVRTTIARGRRHSRQLAGRDRLHRLHLRSAAWSGWFSLSRRRTVPCGRGGGAVASAVVPAAAPALRRLRRPSRGCRARARTRPRSASAASQPTDAAGIRRRRSRSASATSSPAGRGSRGPRRTSAAGSSGTRPAG